MRVKAKLEVNAKLLDEFENRHLTPAKEYLVVGFDEHYFRVMDDAGEAVLYPKYLFEITDQAVPNDWVRREFDEGEYHVDLPECARAGFYEDVSDGEPGAVATFQRVLQRLR